MARRSRQNHSARQRANSELADSAIRHGVGQASHRPVQVYLQLASACNLSCYMCSEHNRPSDARRGVGLVSLSPVIFARLEEEVFPWSSQLYLGVGGEPTYSENFVDFLTRAGAANQEVHLITNGTFLGNSEVASAIADHVSEIQISIDAASQETYERIRIGSRWSRLMEGIEKLQAYRAKSSHSSRLTLNMVLMRSNVHELPDFVDLAYKIGADAVHAQHVITATEQAREEPLLLEPALFDEQRLEAISRAKRNHVQLDLPAAFEDEDRGNCSVQPDSSLDGYAVPCRDPYQSLIVLYDGRVFACCHPLAHDKMQLGDLSTQSLEEVWNGTLYRNLRAGLRTGDVPDICRKCSIVNSPPPVIEDVEAYADSPGIAAHYKEPASDMRCQGGVLEYIESLRLHADMIEEEHWQLREHSHALESERDQLLQHARNVEKLGPMALLRRLRHSAWRRLTQGPKDSSEEENDHV